jgi:hypothetical protein
MTRYPFGRIPGSQPTFSALLQELSAATPGFLNASVEFDIATLRPTYRLLWGAAGESNALAVAQGLGFAPSVVAAARQVRNGWHATETGQACSDSCLMALITWHDCPCISSCCHACLPQVAQQLHHGSQARAQRSGLLQASLAEQLEDARRAAAAAAEARAAAEGGGAEARLELEQAQQQHLELAKAEKGVKAAGATARQRAAEVLASVKAGTVSAGEAEEVLRRMEREAAAPDLAAVRLMGLRAAAKVCRGWGQQQCFRL